MSRAAMVTNRVGREGGRDSAEITQKTIWEGRPTTIFATRKVGLSTASISMLIRYGVALESVVYD
jgi:hypothetical protein